MSAPNPGTYESDLERTVGQLSAASSEVHRANEEFDKLDEEWLEHYDNVLESLRQERAEADRKGDPAEHVIVAAARRENRSLYTRWSRAKRAIKKAEVISSNRRQEVSAHQSLIKSEHTEAGAQGNLDQAADRVRAFHRGRAA